MGLKNSTPVFTKILPFVALAIFTLPNKPLFAEDPQAALACGIYQGKGKMYFNREGRLAFPLIIEEQNTENKFVEALVIDGPLEEKLRRALSEVIIKFRVSEKIDSSSQGSKITLLKFLPRGTTQTKHLLLLKKEKCKNLPEKSAN